MNSMQTNNVDICTNSMNSVYDMIYDDYIPILSQIYKDIDYNRKFLVFVIVVQ